MGDGGAARSTLQALLVRLYAGLHGDALRRSRFGRGLFEWAYVTYKVLLEAGPIHRLASYIQPETWVIDVGANIGVFTIPFARQAAQGLVIAIEPEAENFAALQRRIRAAGVESRVVLSRAVAAEQDGTLWLEVNRNHPGDHKLGPAGIAVPAVTLDGLIKEHGDPAVSLVKIDVQGSELRVLQGAVALIARCRPALFIEIDDAALRRQGASAGELLEWLGTRGYVPYLLRRQGHLAPTSLTALLATSTYVDALFLPDGRRL